jgi:hypothetical protein
MTFDKAHELITMRVHSLEAVGALSREYELDLLWETLPGMKFESAFKT